LEAVNGEYWGALPPGWSARGKREDDPMSLVQGRRGSGQTQILFIVPRKQQLRARSRTLDAGHAEPKSVA
jgi:hypothetical protein